WAHERILNTTTIREWTNKKRLPVFMTATCELSRYDDPEVESAGEMLVFNPDGGSVGMLTTTRTVFSGGNQELNTAFFQTVLDEDSGTSQARCLGDICKDTKNSPLVTSVTNMRNFSLLGDPAILLAYPKHSIYITEVPDTIRSLDHVIMKGYVGTDSGDTLQGFNGFLYPKVFDKRSQISTLDNDNVAGAFSYTMFRNVIHKGLASVVDGVFEFEFVVPRDIDYTLGEGRVSLYAVSEDIDAHGAFEGFIIGGTSEDVEVDDLGPVVDLFMNDSLFISGGITNEDPWLYARVYDESGINTVGNGIGHDLKAVLDESYDSPFVLNTYFSADLDTYKSGVVRYPFNDLEEGEHSLELKVWDVQNNSTLATTKFIVASSVEVALQDVIAYPNPATDNVSFRLTHNQTCNEVDVEVDIYDATGRKIKAFKTELFSHTGRTDVLKWDLISNDGGEVPAGVYVFQIKMTTKNGASTQYGSKLVVLKP
ncbi:MAG TPA: type IX secretion system sortase PorU, partial [Flavobacteriales bacterium]|nr:type IX secretion system sortase PorU [Flavobacteriales bacterium]